MTGMMSTTVKDAGTTPRFVRSTTTTSTRLVFHVVREAGVQVSRTLVAAGDVIRLGANEGNEVVLADPTVSRFHARVERTPRAWRLVDQDSMNGTRVDGVTMRDGDLPLSDHGDLAPRGSRGQCKLELGDSVVVVVEEDAAAPAKVETLDQASFGELYGASLPMRRLFAILDRVCASEANVLIEGASGTGKELVATEIVRRGPRRKGAFVIVDCSAIAPSVLESELFGHVRGAFTGAERDRVGAFEAAQHGTIFLDEIGELPLDMQPKLLRALESGEIRRVGETRTRKVDVRVVAATNRSLEREVNHGRFREDLYFRLSVVTLRVPTLKERLDDLELLVGAILESLDAADRMGLFTPELFADMRRYDWPGNVRELRNFVERTIVMGGLRPDTPARATAAPAGEPTIDLEKSFRDGKEDVIVDYERRYLRELLEWAGGNVTKAARKARIDRMSLYRLMQRHQTAPEREPKE